MTDNLHAKFAHKNKSEYVFFQDETELKLCRRCYPLKPLICHRLNPLKK